MSDSEKAKSKVLSEINTRRESEGLIEKAMPVRKPPQSLQGQGQQSQNSQGQQQSQNSQE